MNEFNLRLDEEIREPRFVCVNAVSNELRSKYKSNMYRGLRPHSGGSRHFSRGHNYVADPGIRPI